MVAINFPSRGWLKPVFLGFALVLCTCVRAQEVTTPGATTYKKRVLESAELQILTSYYQQDGNNAAVTGGRGTEYLTDVHPTVIMAVPLNDDDVLTASFGVSAYTSASSSNVDPFDGRGEASPFQASSGASGSDVWINGTVTYAHSSDDRNNVVTATLSGSNEYDYKSFGVGGSYTRLMNEQNTELTVHGSAYLDNWKRIYPIELRTNEELLDETARNSYNAGINFSQLLSRRAQGSLSFDFVQQQGLLSTPFQRVYFGDVADRYVQDFPLADDVERLPGTRTKLAFGGRLHYYLSERFVVRTFYRYYTDDWGIGSHTANLEVPIKMGQYFSLRPGYRFYHQTAADYFAGFNGHLSTETYYTSDFDLSAFTASQYSLGLSYLDILGDRSVLGWGLKSVDLNTSFYRRDNGFRAGQVAIGMKVVHR
ncbi:DUF3570 domain-containing protein [Lewinella sp. IMCC34183]|uniref:DUF3570 domain-containing protein n=1 Tax=Lewinella sp. IMCC34183 TaxID=2248762 RepID=UPI001E56EFC2|nr:DUF3570 domain-containing protein [Lewinella sp. IMCC34183]